jgi:hypothetical protein
METEPHSGCTQFEGAPHCECGALATRLVGQCENCWKQQPIWPRKLSPKAIATADKRKVAAKK